MTVPSSRGAPHRIVAYPPRSLSVARYVLNMGAFMDATHVAQAAAGGAGILRVQFGWDTVETWQAGGGGALTLSAGEIAFLQACETNGVQPLVVAAFGPPWQTVGTLTTTADVPSGSAAGTQIPVQSYAFPITFATQASEATRAVYFAGGLFFGFPSGISASTAYYGDLITDAGANYIALAAPTHIDLPGGTSLPVQRLPYNPPVTDNDASITAYSRYALFLAAQIATYCPTLGGYVDFWNEPPWAHNTWERLAYFYDGNPPAWITTAGIGRLRRVLTAQAFPPKVSLVNGGSDKSGGGAAAVDTSITVPDANTTFDSWHPYGVNPEQACWQYYSYGIDTALAGRFTNPAGVPSVAWPAFNGDQKWGEIIPADAGGNFRQMGFNVDNRPGGPWPQPMITESGLPWTDDTQQARYNVRKVLSAWGVGSIGGIYALNTNDSTGYSIYPTAGPRQSHAALQRTIAVLGRMGSTKLVAPVPTVVGWASDAVPLMTVSIQGDTPGNSVLYAWQRTWINNNSTSPGGAGHWTTVASPAAATVSIYVPTGLTVAECTNVISGASVTVTGPASNVITVPLTDDPVAIRFAPA